VRCSQAEQFWPERCALLSLWSATARGDDDCWPPARVSLVLELRGVKNDISCGFGFWERRAGPPGVAWLVGFVIWIIVTKLEGHSLTGGRLLKAGGRLTFARFRTAFNTSLATRLRALFPIELFLNQELGSATAE
jgi:hypothetical protein